MGIDNGSSIDVGNFQIADEEIEKRNKILSERGSVSNIEKFRPSERRQARRDKLQLRFQEKAQQFTSSFATQEVQKEAWDLYAQIESGEKSPQDIEPKKSEAIKIMAAFKEKNTLEALAEFEHLQELLAEDRADLREITLMIRELKRPPALDELAVADEIRAEIKTCQEALHMLEKKNPESFYALNLKKLKGYSEQVRSGQRIIETEYVQRNLEDIIDDLSKGNITFLYGETGSGKTEIANLAAQRFSGQRAEVIRGYSGMGSQELFGHLALSAANSERAKDVPDRIDAEYKAWQDEHAGAEGDASQKALEQITQKICQESGVTVTDFVLGGVYRAARDGKVIILDEANYIPPGLLAKLNDIMTKVPGETITVQEDGIDPIVVREGFGIIMTGNMNTSSAKRYKERVELDPALLDRVTLKEYDYLPQSIEGSMEQNTDPHDKQIFEIVVGTLLTDGGGLNIPKGSLEKLWNLSQYAKMTQMAFAGKIEASSANSFQVNSVGAHQQTDLSISPRGLQKIIGEWSGDQYGKELDHYIYKHLIARATNPTQRAYLYQLGQKCGFFGEGWTQPAAGDYSTDMKQFVVEDPSRGENEREFVAPPNVIESIYGKPPARKEWPEGSDTESVEDRQESAELDRMQERFEAATAIARAWPEKIGNVCPIPGAPEAAPSLELEVKEESGEDAAS